MIRFDRRCFILPLVGCLLWTPALASHASVAHEMHHAHHKATTHSSPLCSWFCKAGQGIESTDSIVLPAVGLVALIPIGSSDLADEAFPLLVLSRGPPARSSS